MSDVTMNDRFSNSPSNTLVELNHATRRMIQPQLSLDLIGSSVDVHARCKPAKGLGNDFYDCIQKENGDLVFFIADVSGKDLDASLFAVAACAYLRAYAAQYESAVDMADRVNGALCQHNPGSLFLKCFMGVYQEKTAQLSYVNAGYPSLYLLRQNQIQTLPSTNGVAFGVDPKSYYQEEIYQLEAADRLFMFSNYLNTLHNQRAESYEGRLHQQILKASTAQGIEWIAGIEQDIDQFLEGADSDDDLILVLLAVKERAVTVGTQLKVHFKNDISELTKLKDVVTLYGSANHISDDIQLSINLALEECITNTIFYGYTDHNPHLIYVTFLKENATVQVLIEDDGVAFDPLTQAPAHNDEASLDDMAIGGLGIKFVKTIVDQIEYKREADRNILSLTVSL